MFAEEFEGRPQQECGGWVSGVVNLLWVVKLEAHEGSSSGRRAQIEKGLPGMGRGRIGQVVNAPFIEGTGLATSHGVTVKSLVGLEYP